MRHHRLPLDRRLHTLHEVLDSHTASIKHLWEAIADIEQYMRTLETRFYLLKKGLDYETTNKDTSHGEMP